jgi:ABC-2 type transport system ATP-binding protein
VSEQAVSLRGVGKSFAGHAAVIDLSLDIPRGSIFGLLGPNGAGKTTTVSLIAGLLRADEGEVLIDGSPLRGDTDPAKSKLGLVPQELALYDELSAGENLRFFGGLHGVSGAALGQAIGTALLLVGLQDRIGHRVATFSGGMKRRLNLAAGLLHDPEILLLDEPTVGVDPQSRNAIFENLEYLKSRGKALLYTTHYMEEVERLADRIVVIDHGRVIADDTLRGLYAGLPADGGRRYPGHTDDGNCAKRDDRPGQRHPLRSLVTPNEFAARTPVNRTLERAHSLAQR